MPTHSIDSSCLINGWYKLYPPTTFEGLWDELLPGLIASGDLRASKEVLREIEKQDDDVLAWCKQHPDLFVEIDDEQQKQMQMLLAHPYCKTLCDVKKGRNAADPWVVSLALSHNPTLTVVTEETPGGKVPRIPDACNAIGLKHVKLLGLIQAQGWTFRRR